MFRSLALVPVRQKQRQPAQAPPLRFTRRDELVNHHLCAVGKITELPLPNNQDIRIRSAITIFKAEHGFFRQQRIDDLEIRLLRIQVLQWNKGACIVLVMQYGVAVKKGATPAVLTCQTHLVTLRDQARVRKRLGKTPVQRQVSGQHLATVVINTLHPVMQWHTFWNGGHFPSQLLHSLRSD